VSVAGRASQIEAVPPASIASSAIHSSCSRVRASAGSATSPSENGDLAGDEDGEGESADGSGQAGVAEGREQEGAEGGELEGGADGCEGDVAGQAEAAVPGHGDCESDEAAEAATPALEQLASPARRSPESSVCA
jgi:hypothetical protein